MTVAYLSCVSCLSWVCTLKGLTDGVTNSLNIDNHSDRGKGKLERLEPTVKHSSSKIAPVISTYTSLAPSTRGQEVQSSHTPRKQKPEVLLNDYHTCLSLLLPPMGTLMLILYSYYKDQSNNNLK